MFFTMLVIWVGYNLDADLLRFDLDAIYPRIYYDCYDLICAFIQNLIFRIRYSLH